VTVYYSPELSSLTDDNGEEEGGGDVGTGSGQHTGSVTVIMHNPAATGGGDACHARRPQSRRHSPTARSSRGRVPSARAPRGREAEGRGRGKGRQELEKGKIQPGVKQVSAEKLRDGSKGWKLVS